jgi:uncharacterized membrane-anchored protein
MKLATLRRRTEALPGISGVARLDRTTTRLAGRLNHGDVAVIDHVDLDRVTAEALAAAKPIAVINAQPSISGRYPNLGPDVLMSAGIVLIDNVGAEVFAGVKEGMKVRIYGNAVFLGEDEIASGTRQDPASIDALMTEAKSGLSAQLEAFAMNTGEFMMRERGLLLDGDGIPEVRTRFARRHAVVVVRGHGYERDLKSLRHYIREYHPVLVGVDGGADVLVEAGYKPDMIIGDLDSVSDNALTSGAEVVVHAHPDGRAPGLARAQDLGVDARTFPTSASSEDAALLVAEHNDAELIVSVGSHATLTEFLDRGREGMASSFLTRLRMGAKLVDAHSVSRMYRTRISVTALLLLVIAALVAVVAALSIADSGHTFLNSFDDGWHRITNWVQDTFS